MCIRDRNYEGLNLNQISDGPLWMTDKPETYKVCKDSPLYFRWHRKIHQHNGTSYKMNFLAEMVYGDGSKEVIDEEIVDLTTAPIQSWEQSEIHVLNLAAIMYNSQYFNQNKTFAKLTFKITYYQSPFSNGDATQEYKLVFDNSPQGHCCGCHVHFLYAGERGNNDTMTARCESVITLDVEFNKIGKVEECGEYLGGKVSLTPEEVMLAKTVWIYHEDWEYLTKFISLSLIHI